jgi:hypothetical protein
MTLWNEIMDEYRLIKKNKAKKRILSEIEKTYANILRFGSNVPNDNNLFPKLHDELFKFSVMLNYPIDSIMIYRNYLPKLKTDKHYFISAVGRYIGGEIIVNGNIYDLKDLDAISIRPKETDDIELNYVVGAIYLIIFSK